MESEHGKEGNMRANKRWMWSIIILGVAGSIGGCAVQRERARQTVAMQASSEVGTAPGGVAAAAAPAPSAGAPPAVPASRPARHSSDEPAAEEQKGATLDALAENRADRYLIRNATLAIEVRDARQASAALVTAVRAAGGYVADT